MSALGFVKEGDEGRYSNETYTVWDVVPRNALVDYDGDMYVIKINRYFCWFGYIFGAICSESRKF